MIKLQYIVLLNIVSYKIRKFSFPVVINVITRLVFGPGIFVSVWMATIVNFILDWADGEFFKRAGYKKEEYKIIDKILDLYWYAFIISYAVVNDIPGLPILIFLFVYRLVGQILFFIKRKQILLFIFPNFFEIFFYFYLASIVFKPLSLYLTIPNAIYPMGIIFLTVMIREYLLHIRDINWSDFFTGKKTYWNK